jgi:hypothetical protein
MADTTTADIIFDKWIPWNDELKEIPYKTDGGVGPGETRIAHIFKTTPKGQNSCYDLDLSIDGLHSKGEVKEADQADTFRVAKSGRDKLRPIKEAIVRFQNNCKLLLEMKDNLLCIEELKSDKDNLCNLIKNLSINDKKIKKTIIQKLEVIIAISPDEICEGNLILLNELFLELNKIKSSYLTNLKIFQTNRFESTDTMSVKSYKYYKILQAFDKNAQEIEDILGKEELDKISLIENLEHIFIDSPQEMNASFSKITDELFNENEMTWIFVNKTKGYFIRKNSAIALNRITLGCPRFRILFEKTAQGAS